MNPQKLLFIILSPLLLTQCARTLSPRSALSYSYARAAAPFAAMSELVYKDSEKPDEMEEKQRKICDGFLISTGWRREPDFHQTLEEDRKGLQYSAWINRDLHPNVLCVVFRGTEFLTEGQDMVSNLHPLLGRLPGMDQYEHIRHHVGPAFDKKYGKRIREGKLVVLTAGHSLGGGLAQNFMYWNSDKVHQCYAFDPSPVTGFTDLDKKSRAKFNDLLPTGGFPDAQIIRVNQKGEVLEPMRNLGSRFTYYTNQIDRIRVDVGDYPGLYRKQTPFSRHSISGLAIGLMLTGGYSVDVAIEPAPEPERWLQAWWDQRVPVTRPSR